jgi:hypothetical protein
MKDYAKRLHPEAYESGFSAIVAETLAHPLPEYNDYNSTWDNIQTTHATLNRIGFYQVQTLLLRLISQYGFTSIIRARESQI